MLVFFFDQFFHQLCCQKEEVFLILSRDKKNLVCKLTTSRDGPVKAEMETQEDYHATEKSWESKTRRLRMLPDYAIDVQ